MTELETIISPDTPETQAESPLEDTSSYSEAIVDNSEQAIPETDETIQAEGIQAARELVVAEELVITRELALAGEQSATMTFHVLPEVFSIMRLPIVINRLPEFVFQSSFYSISYSKNEVSVVCEERLVVRHIDHYELGNVAQISGNWRIMRLGVMDLSTTGVAARFAGVLAAREINLNIIATYDTDYVMVPQGKLARAVNALREAGYTVNMDG
jgi:uncharacterized protein